MKFTKKGLWAILLLSICLIIKWYSTNSYRVEIGYSSHFFPGFASLLRKGLGNFSISIGDILYGFVVGWLIFKVGRILFFTARKKKRGETKIKLGENLYNIFIICCSVYIIFNLFWGINYNRKGIAWQLGLSELKYGTEELKEINCLLIAKINSSKQEMLNSKSAYPSNKKLYVQVSNAYELLGEQYSFLKYTPSSLKTSMWGWLGNYAGFTGYYNPFTGEAQLNTTIPKFLQPFTACHEVGHQLGYAKEMEANFVGYLAATASPEPLFHYSVYLDLFTYANRNLFIADSLSAKLYRKELIGPVRDDIKEWILFIRRHKGVLEPIVRWGYGKFLESNEQPQGILSYDEVTGFLIAYYKKFGKI